mgnify:CR=1 FL=1
MYRVIDSRLREHLAEGERHLIVDLGDHYPRPRDGGLHIVADKTVTVVALAVGGTDLNECHVATDDSRLDHRADLTDVARNHVEAVRLAHRPQGADGAHAGQRETLGRFGGEDSRETGRDEHRQIADVAALRNQRFEHARRFTARLADDDVIARLGNSQRLGDREEHRVAQAAAGDQNKARDMVTEATQPSPGSSRPDARPPTTSATREERP